MILGTCAQPTKNHFELLSPTQKETLQQHIKQATRIALFAGKLLAGLTVSALLCYYHPHFFVAGFFFGALFHDHVGKRIEKIEEIWNKSLGIRLGMIGFGLLTLPFTLSMLSLYAGSRWAHNILEETPN